MLKKIYRSFLTFYSPKFPELITYMLQASEYKAINYLVWFWKTTDFSRVQQRKKLEKTTIAQVIYMVLGVGSLAQVLFGIALIVLDLQGKLAGGILFGLGIIILYPVFWSQVITIPVFLARIFILNPSILAARKKAEKIFAKSKAIKIAVSGSYGKTSIKEMLLDVLSSKYIVAATPKNKNVALSHAQFALGLDGKEEILIVEFGEGAPGDIYKFASVLKPSIAIITGLSPVHQDKYKSVEQAGEDLFTLTKFVSTDNLYVNNESEYIQKFISKKMVTYNRSSIADFKIINIKSSLEGLSFDLVGKKSKLHLKSALLGRHQIAPLALVAYLALKLDIKPKDIEQKIASLKAYEHRMDPYKLSGATIIDDTYNGNIEGLRAGLELLKELKAKRKVYITPGLVDQGKLTKKIHQELGLLIAKANPDEVVLMSNSVTKYIQEGLKKANFKNKISIQEDPLFYYQNLANFVAKGDLVLMQNDWTDNYV